MWLWAAEDRRRELAEGLPGVRALVQRAFGQVTVRCAAASSSLAVQPGAGHCGTTGKQAVCRREDRRAVGAFPYHLRLYHLLQF